MGDQARAGVEAPAALGAAVRLLAGVGAAVDDQGGVVAVVLAALQAGVEFDGQRMHRLVSGEGLNGGKHLLAVGAVSGS